MIEIQSMQRMCHTKSDRQRRRSDQDLRILLGHITILEAVGDELLQRSAIDEYNQQRQSIPTIKPPQTSPSNLLRKPLREESFKTLTHIEVVEICDGEDDDEEVIDDLEDDREHALTRVRAHHNGIVEFVGSNVASRPILVGSGNPVQTYS